MRIQVSVNADRALLMKEVLEQASISMPMILQQGPAALVTLRIAVMAQMTQMEQPKTQLLSQKFRPFQMAHGKIMLLYRLA